MSRFTPEQLAKFVTCHCERCGLTHPVNNLPADQRDAVLRAAMDRATDRIYVTQCPGCEQGAAQPSARVP